jgi:hypothetical protein
VNFALESVKLRAGRESVISTLRAPDHQMRRGIRMAPEESKRCTKCGDDFPSAHFLARNRKCRVCRRQENAKWRDDNREYDRARKAKWNKEHPESPETNRARGAKWRSENPEKHKERGRRYYAANAEKVCTRTRNHSAANLEKYREIRAKYRKNNPLKMREMYHARIARERSAGGRGVFVGQWRQILSDSLGLCAYCNERRPLEMDHIEPFSRGGQHDVENIAAACRACNSGKCDTALMVWLARRRAR